MRVLKTFKKGRDFASDAGMITTEGDENESGYEEEKEEEEEVAVCP